MGDDSVLGSIVLILGIPMVRATDGEVRFRKAHLHGQLCRQLTCNVGSGGMGPNEGCLHQKLYSPS